MSRFVGPFCPTGTAGTLCFRRCLRRRRGFRGTGRGLGRRRRRFGDARLDADVALLAAGEVPLNHPGRNGKEGSERSLSSAHIGRFLCQKCKYRNVKIERVILTTLKGVEEKHHIPQEGFVMLIQTVKLQFNRG